MDTTHAKPYMNIPPGDFVADELDERGWTQATLAEVLGVSLQTVSKLIKAKQTISVDMAKRLSSAFGQSPQYWLALENNYQLRKADFGESHGVEQNSALFTRVPVASLRKKGWVREGADADAVRTWLTRLWQTDDVETALEQSVSLPMAARRSSAYSQYSSNYAAVWFQVARRVAATYEVPRYDKRALESLVTDMPRLSADAHGVGDFLGRLNDCGIKAFRLSHVEKTYTDGAAFWDGANPAIVFTARLDWDDSFWFTMGHEIGHLLLHLTKSDDYFIDEGVDGGGEREQQADEYAAVAFGHQAIYDHFAPLKHRISRGAVEDFARVNGISASVVVGCLHHHTLLSHRNLNDLRAKLLPQLDEAYLGDERVLEAVDAA